LGFFNQAPARPPEAPLGDRLASLERHRKNVFHMAQRTRPGDSSHPLLRKPMPACLPTALTAPVKPCASWSMRHPALSVPSTLQATPYERSAQRVDHANGYKNKGRPDPHGRGHLRGAASALWWLLSQRTPVARQIRGIFNAPDAHEAQRLLNCALKEWQVSHPQLAFRQRKICLKALPSSTCPRPTGCACALPTAWSG
jgi:hypothetical protein